MENQSLRTRFILFALACLVPFAAVAGYILDRNLELRNDEIVGFETSLASSISRSVSSILTSNTDALEGIAQLPSVLSLDAEQASVDLGQARRVRPELSGIFLVDTDQAIVTSSGVDPSPLLDGITPQFEQTVAQNVPSVSNAIRLDDEVSVVVLMVPVTTIQETETTTSDGSEESAAPADEFSVVPTPTPTSDDEQSTQPPGKTNGVIGGVIQVDRLSQAVMPPNRGMSEIAVTDGSNVIFSSSGIDRTTTTLLADNPEPVQVALEGGISPFTVTDPGGASRDAVAAPVTYEYAPWIVIVTHPAAGLLDGISTTQTIIVVMLCIFVIFALAIVLGEVTARPLRTLSRQARELHQGTLKEPIVPVGTGEIRTLSERFAEMADQINSQVAGMEENQLDRERQAAQMRDLLRRTNRLQEDERRRIAGEIHDAVTPLITGALYQARALQMTNGSTPEEELDSSLRSVSELLERATDELHDVIFELRPPDLDDLGIVAAIEAYVDTVQRTGLSCRLEVAGEDPVLAPEVRLSLYRIVQEALHNVVRHAGADEAVVRLETNEESVRLTIRDNGAGFDPVQAIRPTSLGLLSMQERADAIGATFNIVSRVGGGTAIVIERPNTGDILSDAVLESMMSMSNGAAPAEHQAESAQNGTHADAETSDQVRQEHQS